MAMEISNQNPQWVYPKSLGLSPSQRWGHSACYFHGVVYVFGGCCGGLHFDDVLALNLTTMTWTTLATRGTGPGPRDSHSALVVGHKMVVFGGTDGSKKVNDLHMLDLLSKEWSKPLCSGTPPTPRESHTSTLIGDNILVIFGGSGEGEGNYLNDLYVLDLNSMRWSSPNVKGEVPVPRDSHGSVCIGSRMFVYGGDCGSRYNGEVDVIDTCSMTWSRMAVQGSSPGVRAGHAMVNNGSKVYVVGGVGENCYYNDVWVLDLINFSWTQLEVHGQKPQGRFAHTAIFTDSDIAIYGGCGEDERPLDELLLLRLGGRVGYHPLGKYNISVRKMFKGHWNGKRKFIRNVENKSDTTMLFGNKAELVERNEGHAIELELKPSIHYSLDMLHPKRRRTSNSKTVELKTEQEDSLHLTQHSVSSHSDREQASSGKKVDELISHEFPMFKHHNHVPKNFEHEPRSVASPVKRVQRISSFMEQHHASHGQEQFPHTQQPNHESFSAPNMVGSEVHGKVDASFDSGYLMTAVVNGRIFRGVLFSPAPSFPQRRNLSGPAPSSPIPSSIPVAVPIHYPNSPPLRHAFQPPCHHPLISNARSPQPVNKQGNVRCDLQGVVLTLGGPGSSPSDP